MTIKKVWSFSIYKRLLTAAAVLLVVFQPFSTLAHALGGTKTVCPLPAACDYADIPSAIAGSAAGDVLDVQAGTYTMTSATNVNKQLTIAGQPGATITTSGGAQILTFTAAGSTLSGFAINKTDKTSQNIIGIQGANTTISSNSFSGQYVLGEGDVARALEVSTTTGVTITGNSFSALRQPAYINDNTTGTITNNHVDGTRGWVAIANTNFTFNGNTWGTNAVDIAFIPGTPNNYPCTTLATIKANNSNANIQNQALTTPCPSPPATPTNLAFSNPPVCDGYTKTVNTTASWSSVPTATSYNYRAWKPGDPIYNSEATAYTTVTSDASQLGSFNLGEGTYYFQVQAVNAANETSDWSASCAANYDITKPTIAVNTVNGSLNPATVSVTGTDNTQLQQVTGHIYNATNTALIKNCSSNVSAANTSTYTLTCNTAGLADGTYTIRAISSDKAGNLSTTNSSVKFDIDHTAPMGLAHLSPADGSFTTTANAMSIDWTDATDPHGPVSYFYESSTSNATNPDGSFASPVYQSGALSSSTIPTPNTPAGVYYWHVRAVDAAGSSTSWTTAWKITVDNTKPTIVVNTANNAVNPATVSVTGTDNTELKQVTGHIYNESNSTLIKNCSTNVSSLNVSTYTVSCNTNTLADGTYTIRANALDKAGNLSTTLSSTKFVIDHTAPNISLTSPANNATVPGTSLTQSWASTSTDVDHYVYESFNNAAATSLRWSENMGTHTSKTANNVANATFWWRVTAYDHAGNATVSPLWKLTVSNPVPSVTAQDFSTWDNSANGFMGITAGFGLNDFSHVNSITVTLANADGDIVTNTADPDFISLINANGWTQFSSPFVVSGVLDDTFCNGGPCWVAGAHTWTATDKPTKVTATVVGKNNLGQTVTKTATNTTLAESPSYESLLPTAPAAQTDVLGDSTNTPGMGGSLPIATYAAVVNPDSTVELVSDDATSTDDSTTNQTPAKTLGAATNAPSDNNSDSDAAATATGLAWYWWAIIIAAVAGAAWWLFAARRRSSGS